MDRGDVADEGRGGTFALLGGQRGVDIVGGDERRR